MATHYSVRTVQKVDQKIIMHSRPIATLTEARRTVGAWRKSARTPKLFRFEILRHRVEVVK